MTTNRWPSTLSLLLTLGLLVTSCTKSRPEAFVQGEGVELLTVKDYHEKSFDLTTKDKIKDGIFSDSEVAEIDAKNKSIRDFGQVDYQSSSTLLGKLDPKVIIYGRPHHKYSIRYVLNDQFLIVYKVAKEEDLPIIERSYSKAFEENLYGVPLFGYKLEGLFTIDKVKNEFGEQTHQLKERKVAQLKDATHFKANFNNPILYEAVSKQNIFPESFFEGEWFYAATTVSKSQILDGDSDGPIIGGALTNDFVNENVSRIKFDVSKETLRILNLNVDKDAKVDATIDLRTSLTIPIERVAYKQKPNELKDDSIGGKEAKPGSWKDLRYLKLDMINSSTNHLSSKQIKGTLSHLEVTEDYFSINLRYDEFTMEIKYSFYKAKKPVNGRIYFKNDRKLFGFFSSKRPTLNSTKTTRAEDEERFTFLNRFHPVEKNGRRQIVYYFTKTSTKDAEIRGMVRETFKEWQNAFADAGTNIDFILDETKEVNLGDIRYNTINLIDVASSSGLLGYGPSIVDTASGEIISASTNIFIHPVREGLTHLLRDYVKFKLGLLDKKYLGYAVLGHEGGKTGKWSTLANAPKSLRKSLYSAQMSKDGKLQISTKEGTANSIEQVLGQEFAEEDAHQHKHGSVGGCSSYANSYRDALEQINKLCNSKEKGIKISLDEYIGSIKDKKQEGLAHNENEEEVFAPCIKQLLPYALFNTTLHEIGHNIGLRHNFIASNDVRNFYTPKETDGLEVHASSVMDYIPSQVYQLNKAGKYDIAALRFAYGDHIEIESGTNKKEFAKISTNKSIQNNLGGKKLWPYKFCTDEDTLGMDPLCARHDIGRTPLEIVKNTILQHNTDYAIGYFRGDRAFGPSLPGREAKSFSYTYSRLKKIYDQWRYYLNQYMNAKAPYLEGIKTQKELVDIVAAMRKNPNFKEYVDAYYPAANEARNFLLNVAFMDNKFCVAKIKGSTVPDVEEFEKIQLKYFQASNTTVTSCKDIPLAFFSNDSKTVVESVQEFGFSSSDVRSSLERNDINEPIFSLGVQNMRVNAMNFLLLRTPFSILTDIKKGTIIMAPYRNRQSFIQDYFPSFMDEPQTRNVVTGMLIKDRLLKGQFKSFTDDQSPLDLSPIELLNDKVLKEKKAKLYVFNKFKFEQKILELFLSFYHPSLEVPNNNEESEERSTLVKFTTTLSREVNTPLKMTLASGRTIIPEGEIAEQVMEEYLKLESLKKLAKQPILEPMKKDALKLTLSKAGILIPKAQIAKMTLQEYLMMINKRSDIITNPRNGLPLAHIMALSSVFRQEQGMALKYAELSKKTPDPDSNFTYKVGDKVLTVSFGQKNILTMNAEKFLLAQKIKFQTIDPATKTPKLEDKNGLEFVLTTEDFDEIYDVYVKSVSELTNEIKSYNEMEEEYNAKKNLLHNFILRG